MASKAEYLNMMKKLDKESAMRPDEVEEMLPILDDPNLKGLMMPPISAREMDEMLKKANPLARGRDSEMDEMLERVGALKGAMGATMGGNAVADLGLAFSAMKALDPKSTVREGEMAELKGTSGVMSQVSNLYNKLLSGQILTDAQRETLKNMLDPKSVVREGEMESMRDDMLSDLDMKSREAVSALTTMGVSLTDAINAVMGVSESPASMTEGALGSLPKENRVRREEEIDPMRGDTTQSLDMQDSINT